jgi:hypothetical protein
LFYFAREAAGASSARHSLRPLISQGQEFEAKLGRVGREIARPCPQTTQPLSARPYPDMTFNWTIGHKIKQNKAAQDR